MIEKILALSAFWAFVFPKRTDPEIEKRKTRVRTKKLIQENLISEAQQCKDLAA